MKYTTWMVRFAVGEFPMFALAPGAEGEVRGVTATFDEAIGVVVLRGVHPAFIAANRAAQAKPVDE